MTNDTNETNETALSQHCARLFYAAKEADVPTVVEDGTFMPTLYVATVEYYGVRPHSIPLHLALQLENDGGIDLRWAQRLRDIGVMR